VGLGIAEGLLDAGMEAGGLRMVGRAEEGSVVAGELGGWSSLC